MARFQAVLRRAGRGLGLSGAGGHPRGGGLLSNTRRAAGSSCPVQTLCFALPQQPRCQQGLGLEPGELGSDQPCSPARTPPGLSAPGISSHGGCSPAAGGWRSCPHQAGAQRGCGKLWRAQQDQPLELWPSQALRLSWACPSVLWAHHSAHRSKPHLSLCALDSE